VRQQKLTVVRVIVGLRAGYDPAQAGIQVFGARRQVTAARL